MLMTYAGILTYTSFKQLCSYVLLSLTARHWDKNVLYFRFATPVPYRQVLVITFVINHYSVVLIQYRDSCHKLTLKHNIDL